MSNSISMEIITPTKSFYKGECELVIATTVEGEEGFMAGHAWATKILEPGGLWIREEGEKKFKTAVLAGGFIDVKEGIVIFTDAAEWRADIDVERAKATMERAKEWLENGEEHPDRDTLIAENSIKKAEARIKISEGGPRDK